MPLRVAREKALEAIQLIQQGVDPNKPTETEISTLADQWQEYEATLRTRDRSDRTIADFVYDLRYFRDWQHLSLCLLYTSPSPRDQRGSRMPSSA